MASASDRVYFPSLEACLKGENTLLSWKLVASALSDVSSDRLTSDVVLAFLTDPYVQRCFTEPGTVFGKPNANSKSAFETKTAAINVTPTPNEKYDIKSIKEDALWLSRNAKISEEAALRIVAVEFQSRAQSHLCGPLSTQDVANLKDAVGVNGAQATNFLASINMSNTLDAEAIWLAFEKEDGRRQRLLATYLSERRNFMMATEYAFAFMVNGFQPQSNGLVNDSVAKLRYKMVEIEFGTNDVSTIPREKIEKVVSTYLDALPQCIDHSGSGIQATVEDSQLVTDDIELDWLRTALTEAVHIMSLIFQLLDNSNLFVSAEIVSQWFQFVNRYAFMDRLESSHERIAELVQPVKCLVCVISMKLLNLNRAIPYLDRDLDLQANEDTFLASADILKEMHDSIMYAANSDLITASPVIFSWTLILHRMYVSYQERAERRDLAQNRQAQEGFEREFQGQSGPVGRRLSAGSIVSLESQSYDLFLTDSSMQQDVQIVEQLAMAVTAGGRVYDFMADMASTLGQSPDACFPARLGSRMRLVFLELLKASYPIVGYLPEPVTTLLPVLSGGRQYWDLGSDGATGLNQDIISLALKDEVFLEFYLLQALNRYPYEFLPFISLCRILLSGNSSNETTEIVLRALLKTPSLTFVLPAGFQGYELAQEEDNSNTIRIVEDIPLFKSASSWKRRITDDEQFCIPAGTFGRFVTDSGGVILMEYEYSALSLLGKRLDVNLSADSQYVQLGALRSDEVAETISLLATLVQTELIKASVSSDASTATEAGLVVLREASRALPRTKDIVTVVCDTLDTSIQRDVANLEASDIAVLTACIQFLHAVLPISPGRIWAYMARSALLNTDSRGGRLSRITGSLELFAERFDVLLSSVQFFSSLVDSAMNSTVHRKVGGKFGSRQKGAENVWTGTSDKVLTQVSLSVAQTAVDVLENSSTWRFSSEVQRSLLVRDVVPIMTKLMTYTFSLEQSDSGNLLTSCLKPAAIYVLDSFLSSSSGSLRFQPLLSTLLVAFDLPDSTLYLKRTEVISTRLVGVLDFATSLIKTANYLNKPSTTIESQFFKGASVLARLCAVDDAYKGPSFSLLGALASSVGSANTEPPSLLGHLGPQISKSFLQLLSKLDKPFERSAESIKTWKFFSVIIRNRQQWMANCLLTGKTPREALKGDGKLSKLCSDSVLATALTRLRSIARVPKPELLAILDFFTSAQNYWPWTIFAIRQDKAMDELRAYAGALSSASKTVKFHPEDAANDARIAAYIAETLAMQLYHLRQMGQENEFAERVVRDLDYFLRDGVGISGYNASLHGNFAKNFASRYPGLSLDNFKRSLVSQQELGRQYYYALELADEMLQFDPGWVGPRENGFKNEMEMANLNLSLVEAQTALFHSWEFLLLELSTCLLPKGQLITKQMMQVAEQCLSSNQESQGPARIFDRITQSRANLAMVLVQRLTEMSLMPKDIVQLLTILWTTINGIENPFGSERLQYYRTLLKTLYIVLRGYNGSQVPVADAKTANDSIVAINQGILNILDRVVAQGFRTLVTLIHDPEATVFPEDIALLTAILQACLCIPGMDQSQTQILNIMATHDVLHVATSLFSWSDKLAENGDPVYGELSLLFLLELSTMPLLAEQLACDGLLGQLTSANISTHIQRSNVSPFADNVGAQRCYGIWAKGILPLLLNILTVLGATIAPEVAFVLSRFPNLLKTSVERLEAPGLSRTVSREAPQYVSLIAVSEVHSLSLITRVLVALRMNNNRDIPDVSWDAATLLENVEFWLSSRKLLRERILPLGSREADWRSMKTAAAGVAGRSENKLEEKVVAMLEAVKDILSEAD